MATIDKTEETTSDHILCMESVSNIMKHFPQMKGLIIIQDPTTKEIFSSGSLAPKQAYLLVTAYVIITRGKEELKDANS